MITAIRLGPDRPRWLRYAVGLTVCAAVLALHEALVPRNGGHDYLVLYPGVVLVLLVCGAGPGLITLALCAATVYFRYPLAAGSPAPYPGGDLSPEIFVLSGLVLVAVIYSLHSYADRLRSANRALAASERRLQAIADNVPVSITYIDTDDRVQFANRAFRRMTDHDREPRGETVHSYIGAQIDDIAAEHRHRAFEGEHVRFTSHFQVRGEARVREVSFIPDRDANGAVCGVYGIGYDLTELHQAYERLQALAERLASVREDERRAVALNLHESIAQDLFAARMAATELAKLANGTPGAATVAVELEEALSRAMASVRQVAHDLRPASLAHLRVSEVLTDHARHFGELARLAIEVRETGDFPVLDEATRLVFFRSAQEALTNVARHARASRVLIVFSADAAGVTMTVSDDGVGIARSDQDKVGAFGLLGIRERLRPYGGELRVAGLRSQGTTLTVWLPRRTVAADAA